MRVLHISEDDVDLFGNELTPDNFKFYLQHKDAFKRMWTEQGTGFWLRFTVSLRNFMKMQKKCVINPGDNEIIKMKIVKGCEEAYCKILDDITGSTCSALKNLMMNVAIVAENKSNVVNIAQKSVASDPFYSKISRTAFRELFGDPTCTETFLMMCDKMMVFLHAVESLCVLLKRWTVAKDNVAHVKDIPWKPPANWDSITLLDVFEIHLRQKFGDKLFEVAGLDKTYNWLAQMDTAEVEFRKKLINHVTSGTKKLLPWKPLDREWTQKKLASTDICLHLTKLVWSTYWLSLADLCSNCISVDNVFRDNQREQCAIQVGVTMYHHVFGPNFFNFLFEKINLLKNELDDETLKELENYSWIGKKCGLSKTKWNKIYQSHQLLEKIIPVFRDRTGKMINFIENNEFCPFPEWDKDMYVMYTAWHLPLAKDYLDHIFCWIARFEEVVAPLILFPLLKELQQPLEHLLVVIHQGKFYAQVCMVYVDELDRLYGTSLFNWLRAVEYHETIQDLLSKLWLEDWLFEVLENLQEILNTAWSKQELKDGICSNPNRHRIFAKFLNLEAYPCLETLFCDNPRHFAYWIPTVPEIDKQKNNFKEVESIWKEFCSKMEKGKYSNWNFKIKEWSSFNKELTKEESIMFERMKRNPASLQDLLNDVKEALTMIKEDGDITDYIFSKMNEWLRSVVLLNKCNKSSPVLEKMIENLEFLHKHGCLYMLGKSAIIATEKIETTKRAIFVLQLLQQCTKQIAVSSSKFVCLVEVIVAGNEKFVPCPSKKWFDKITAFIKNHTSAVPTGNLKMVNTNLEKLSKQFWDKKLLENNDGNKKTDNSSADSNETEEISSQNNSDSTNPQNNGDTISKINLQEANNSKTEIKNSPKNVDPETKLKTTEDSVDPKNKLKDFQDSNGTTKLEESKEADDSTNKTLEADSDDDNWDDIHEMLYVKWQELVIKVVNHCYKLSARYREQGGTVTVMQFPHWHTLLFFMREEIGYSGVYLDYGYWESTEEDIEESFKKKLMGFRLSWMEKEIEKWCADSSLEKGSNQLLSLSTNSASLMHHHALARVRIIFSDIIIKTCLTKTLGFKTTAFTNIRSVTYDEINEWGFFILNLVANDPVFWTDMSVIIVNFTAFLEMFADYTHTYMDHLVRMDGGHFFEKCDLDKSWVPHTVEHYRVAILALLRFNLVNFYVSVTSELPLLVNLRMDLFNQVFDNIKNFWFCVTCDEIVCNMWPGGGLVVAKNKLLPLWEDTKVLQPPMKKDVQVLSRLPEFVIGDKSWKPLMENYMNGRFDAVATKLDLFSSSSGKSSTNQNHSATKNLNKNKKKPTSLKFENKGEVKKKIMKSEVSMSAVRRDGACNNVVVDSFSIGHPVINNSWDDSDTQINNSFKTEEPSCSSASAGRERNKNDKDGKSAVTKNVHENAKCDVDNEKKPVTPEITSFANGKISNDTESTIKYSSNQHVPCKDVKTSSSTDGPDGSISKNKTSVKVKALHGCAYCNAVEPSSRVYMKCALCKQHNFRPPMFYCGQECHAKHWNEGHGEQHAAFSRSN